MTSTIRVRDVWAWDGDVRSIDEGPSAVYLFSVIVLSYLSASAERGRREGLPDVAMFLRAGSDYRRRKHSRPLREAK